MADEDDMSSSGLRQRRGQGAAGEGEEEDAAATQTASTGEASLPSPAAASSFVPPTKAADEARREENKKKGKHWITRAMLSPPYKLCVLSVVSVVPIFGMIVALPAAFKKMEIDGPSQSDFYHRLTHWTIASWFTVQFIFNFCMTQFTDPGGCDDIRPTHEDNGQFEMAQSKGRHGDTNLKYAPNFCDHCNNWKPPRSHHCSICQRCVLRMDHHCPFTANCIGMRNHGHFILFYVFAMAGLAYAVTVIALSAAGAPDPKMYRQLKFYVRMHTPLLLEYKPLAKLTDLVLRRFASAGLEIVCQAFLTSLACTFVFLCGCPSINMARTGVTTLEYMFPMKEYVQILDNVYCPLGPGFYRNSGFQNFKDIMGERWWLRLLLPVRGAPIDLSPGLAPRPNPVGADMIQDRIKQVAEEGVKNHVATLSDLGLNAGKHANRSSTQQAADEAIAEPASTVPDTSAEAPDQETKAAAEAAEE